MTDSLNETFDDDIEQVEQQEETVSCNRRQVMKLAALSTSIATASGGAISLSSAPVRAASIAGDDVEEVYSGGNLQHVPPNALEQIKFDGDTKFTINWSGLNRGEVIELRMFIKLAEVVNGEGDVTYDGGRFHKIGQMGIRVQQSNTGDSGYEIKGTDFFENRDYIPVTEESDISTQDVDTVPAGDQCQIDDTRRTSKFIIKIQPNAPGLSTDEPMKWGMVLDIEANLGFGHYFGCEFGTTTDV